MSSIKDFLKLWPEANHAAISAIFNGVTLTQDTDNLPSKKFDLEKTIVVAKNVPPRTLIRLLGSGYRHVIQEDRPDLGYALLTTGLILKKPAVFFKNPVHLLFNSAGATPEEQAETKSLNLEWAIADSKEARLEEIMNFLSVRPKLKNYRAMILTLLDEMIANALDSRLPDPKCKLQITLSPSRLSFACFDQHTKFPEDEMRARLKQLAAMPKFAVREGDRGAGLGIPMMINQCTNFYLTHQTGVGSLTVAAIDLKVPFRDFEITPKNVHLFSV